MSFDCDCDCSIGAELAVDDRSRFLFAFGTEVGSADVGGVGSEGGVIGLGVVSDWERCFLRFAVFRGVKDVPGPETTVGTGDCGGTELVDSLTAVVLAVSLVLEEPNKDLAFIAGGVVAAGDGVSGVSLCFR